MNILHITDFHYKSKRYDQFSQNKIIEKLCNNLQSYSEKIDLVVFTGDFVYSGSIRGDFDEANTILIEKISTCIDIPKHNIIFCSGNHDVNRDSYLPSLEILFDQKIKTSDELFDFVNSQNNDYKNSIIGVQNYNDFIKNYYLDDKLVTFNDLYSTHIREINGQKVGIVSLNSGWRSMDEESFGKLLFPIHLLEQAMTTIKDTHCKLLLIHHPLFWFKEFNYIELQETIHKNFDVIFSGHVHQSKLSAHYKYNNGIFEHVAAASMTYDKSYIGYSIIEYDLINKNEAFITESKYSTDFNHFQTDEKVTIKIPTGEEKNNQNNIRSKMHHKLKLEISRAGDLLLNQNKDDDDETFISLFNPPVIKSKSKTHVSLPETNSENYFDRLLDNENNYMIYGYDKSGKSSLLKYIQIHHLKRYSTKGNVPFYIDFKELSGVIDKDWKIITYISRYFELSRAKTEALVSGHNFRLLIDNFNPHSLLFQKISEFLIDYPNVNFVICCDHITSRIVEEYEIGNREYKKLYFHDITRREVRTYADKWFQTGLENKDEVLDKLITFCKQMEMPLNYWTISILLLIHRKSKFDLSKNIFEILDLCADEILNKKFVGLTRSRINFNQLKVLCGEIANFLLTKHFESSYSTSYSLLLQFLEGKIEENIRLRANGKEILDYLIDSGLLKTKEDDSITFRLNGIFEYFISFNMSVDPELLEIVLKDDLIYLSFKNEFEIYSGIKNGDIAFLKRIYAKTKEYFNEINKEFSQQGTPDSLLIDYVTEDYTKKLEKIAKEIQINTPLTDEDRDLLMDEFNPLNINKGIETKKIYNVKKLDSEIFERYLSILARVYKTMDNINDPVLLNEIFDFLLETYINFGFYLIKEIENDKLFKDLTEQDSSSESNILELLSKIIPIITQTTLSDGIAHYNVEGIIINKIKELKDDGNNNQYKIFILYFVLMDIDEKNIIEYADEIISYSKIGVIKFSSLFKLNYYFAFNGHRNKKVADFLQLKIQAAQLALDNKIDKDRFQQSLDKRRKTNFLKK